MVLLKLAIKKEPVKNQLIAFFGVVKVIGLWYSWSCCSNSYRRVEVKPGRDTCDGDEELHNRAVEATHRSTRLL